MRCLVFLFSAVTEQDNLELHETAVEWVPKHHYDEGNDDDDDDDDLFCFFSYNK